MKDSKNPELMLTSIIKWCLNSCICECKYINKGKIKIFKIQKEKSKSDANIKQSVSPSQHKSWEYNIDVFHYAYIHSYIFIDSYI